MDTAHSNISEHESRTELTVWVQRDKEGALSNRRTTARKGDDSTAFWNFPCHVTGKERHISLSSVFCGSDDLERREWIPHRGIREPII